jgi:hypothetical protein
MKERLVELLANGRKKSAEIFQNETEKWLVLGEIPKHKQTIDEIQADYLLENGVIVPPVVIGQKVYRIWCGEIYEFEVIEFRYDGQKMWIFSYNDEYDLHQRRYIFAKKEIGKIVFLTREEAEAKLKEGGQG